MGEIDRFIRASRILEGHLRALDLATDSTAFKQWSDALRSVRDHPNPKAVCEAGSQGVFVSYALTLHSDKM